jgi:metal-responsive CopG/Arc/MetJ family transcriptional regulator
MTEKSRTFSITLPESLVSLVDRDAEAGKRSRTRQIELIVETYYGEDADIVSEPAAALKPKRKAG